MTTMHNNTWNPDYGRKDADTIGSAQRSGHSLLAGFDRPIPSSDSADSSRLLFGDVRSKQNGNNSIFPSHKSSEDFFSDALSSLALNRDSNRLPATASSSSLIMGRLKNSEFSSKREDNNNNLGLGSGSRGLGLSNNSNKGMGPFNTSTSAPVLHRPMNRNAASFGSSGLRNQEFGSGFRNQEFGSGFRSQEFGSGFRNQEFDSGGFRNQEFDDPPRSARPPPGLGLFAAELGSNPAAEKGHGDEDSSMLKNLGFAASAVSEHNRSPMLDRIREDTHVSGEFSRLRAAEAAATAGAMGPGAAYEELKFQQQLDEGSSTSPSSRSVNSQFSPLQQGTFQQTQGQVTYVQQAPRQTVQFQVNQMGHTVAQTQGGFENQNVFYSSPMQQTHVIDGTTQSATMIHPAPSVIQTPYGYATIQYHTPPPATMQPQVMHRSVIGPSGQQFISVVPLQSSAPVAGQQGYTTYWPAGMPGGAQGGGVVNQVANQVPMNGAQADISPSPVRNRVGRPERKTKRSTVSSTRRDGTRTPPMGHGINSALLEDFRSNKNRVWTIPDVEGHVVEFCQDQNGSRFIQQELEIGQVRDKEIVMAEVLPAVRKLRNDVFGNYVVQKLLEHGTPQMKADLRDTLKGEMLALSLQIYGCRVVQKALESLPEGDLPPLLSEFQNHVISCIHDQNGNHVIQKCIEVMSAKARGAREAGEMSKADYFNNQVEFIVDDVLDNVATLSCHPYGCRVLQRILEHCVDPKKGRALDEIRKCHELLLDDQYGNYVIQHVLQYGRHGDRESILKLVSEKGILGLSKQKFASNVVEKLLKYGTASQRNALVREMLKVVDENTGAPSSHGVPGCSSVVLLMVRDAYANYVVQTTLDVVAEGEEKRQLLDELNANAALLRNYTFAKHIVTKLSA